MKIFYQNYLEQSQHDILLMIGETEQTATDLGTIKREYLRSNGIPSYQLRFWDDAWKYLYDDSVIELLAWLEDFKDGNIIYLLTEAGATEIPLTENQKLS